MGQVTLNIRYAHNCRMKRYVSSISTSMCTCSDQYNCTLYNVNTIHRSILSKASIERIFIQKKCFRGCIIHNLGTWHHPKKPEWGVTSLKLIHSSILNSFVTSYYYWFVCKVRFERKTQLQHWRFSSLSLATWVL